MAKTAAEVVREALDQSIFALGTGAQMKIRSTALGKLRQVTQPGFEMEIGAPGVDPETVWKQRGGFILACTQAVGALAAANALKNGNVVIEENHLKDAYNTVRVANSLPPGNFCPIW